MNKDAITYQIIGVFYNFEKNKYFIEVESNRGVLSQFPVKRETYCDAKIGERKIIPFDDLIKLIDTDDLTEIK